MRCDLRVFQRASRGPPPANSGATHAARSRVHWVARGLRDLQRPGSVSGCRRSIHFFSHATRQALPRPKTKCELHRGQSSTADLLSAQVPDLLLDPAPDAQDAAAEGVPDLQVRLPLRVPLQVVGPDATSDLTDSPESIAIWRSEARATRAVPSRAAM